MASRLIWAAVAAAMIVAGVTWRLAPLGKKSCGSILWEAMVYALVRARSPRAPMAGTLAASFAIATAVEAFRLVHTPWLDAFRLTLAGQQLLGRGTFWLMQPASTGPLPFTLFSQDAAQHLMPNEKYRNVPA